MLSTIVITTPKFCHTHFLLSWKLGINNILRHSKVAELRINYNFSLDLQKSTFPHATQGPGTLCW